MLFRSLYDHNAGANIGTVTPTSTTNLQLLLALSGSTATGWYRIKGSSLWTQVATGSATSSATNPGNRIRWGTDGVLACSAYWRVVAYRAGYTPVTSAHFLGRYYNVTPVTLGNGLRIQASNGPTTAADSWGIAPRYDYGVERAFVSWNDNSPRRTWQSASDTAAQSFVFAPDQTEDYAIRSPLMGVAFVGANFPTATLEAATHAGGVYNTIASIDLRMGYGLKYTRQGATVLVEIGRAHV